VNESSETHISKIMPVPVQRFTWILVGFWTLFIAGLSFYEINSIRQITKEIAISEIRAYCNKDRALRVWAASHGGIYVPVDERTPASPYLEHVPERDLVTPSGRKLTLMNPAYMMRQVGEHFSSLFGVVARMTSLNPLRPENAPDEWERRSLEEFAKSRLPEKIEFTQVAGMPRLRLIQAVRVTPDCLYCHGHQGYKEGDLRGGISVSLSMEDALVLQEKQVFSHLLRAGLIWFIGVVGMLLGGGILRRRVAELDAAQEALQQSRDRLAQKSVELAHSNKDLQDFAYMASHDLREPLVLVQAFSERLRARYGENIPEQGLEYIRRIETAAARMQELIFGVLAYSRVSAKAQPFEEVDLEQIVLQVISDLEMQVAATGGRIEIENLCRIKADPLQIRQLFQNLIANAMKYSRPDLPPRVLITGRMIAGADGHGPAESCCVTVEDNGIGFAAESADRIFGLFQRLHGRSQYEGTGIGLAVCKRIVERHGGTITAESSPGKGARFIITLPVHGPGVDGCAEPASRV